MKKNLAQRGKNKTSEPNRLGAGSGKIGSMGKASGPLRGSPALILLNIAAFLPLCVFCGERYSVDSPSILVYGKWVHLGAFIDSYRYFGALIAHLYSFTKHDPIKNCLPDTVLFILMAGIGTAALVACVARHLDIKGRLSVLALDLAVILSVENVWFCEILTFPESIFLSGAGLLLCFSAVICFVRHRSVKGIAASAVLLILATAVYQQYIVVFTVFTVSVTGCEILGEEHPSAKKAFLKYAGTAALIISAGTVYYLLGKPIAKACKIEGGSRIAAQPGDLMKNAIYYLTHQHSFLKGRGCFKTEIMTAAVLFVAVVWLVCLALYVRKKKRISVAAVVLLAFVLAYGSCYLPGIVSRSHDTRVVFGLFSVFFLFVCGIVSVGKNKWLALCTSCVLAVFLAVNIVAVIRMADRQTELNRNDMETAARIVQAIEAHEDQSGAPVKDLFYCYDQNREATRNGSLFYFDFSILPTLTLQSRNYTPGAGNSVYALSEMPESVYLQYFAGKDWHALNLNEQLVFIDGSAYLCIY